MLSHVNKLLKNNLLIAAFYQTWFLFWSIGEPLCIEDEDYARSYHSLTVLPLDCLDKFDSFEKLKEKEL